MGPPREQWLVQVGCVGGEVPGGGGVGALGGGVSCSEANWKPRIDVELDPYLMDPSCEIHTVWLGSVSRATLPEFVV